MALSIPANDHGALRVFALTDLRALLPEGVEAAKTQAGLQRLFGAKLNPDFVDVVMLDDLAGMRLSDYIATGYDMAPDLVDQRAVDAISGTALLVLSRASGGQEMTLTLAPGVTHVTTYAPFARIAPSPALTNESAKSPPEAPSEPAGDTQSDTQTAKPPLSDARIGGMIATYALLGLFALVGLMIWVAG